MNHVESKLRAALRNNLDEISSRADLGTIRRRASRQRVAFGGAGVLLILLLAGAVSYMQTRFYAVEQVTKPAPSGPGETFGRYAIELGEGFDGNGDPVRQFGIVEIDVDRDSVCVNALVRGVTSLHLHNAAGEKLDLFHEGLDTGDPACSRVVAEALQRIVDQPQDWYIEFHHDGSGGTIRSDLEPISNLPDPEQPCNLLEEDEMSEAVGLEISGGGETLSRELGDGSRVPLCTYFMEGPGRGLTVYVEDSITPAEFQRRIERDPTNTEVLTDLRDDAFIHGGSSVSVRVGEYAVTATVQNYDSSLVANLVMQRLGAYVADELREHSPGPTVEEDVFKQLRPGWNELTVPPEPRAEGVLEWVGRQANGRDLVLWGGYSDNGGAIFGSGFSWSAQSGEWSEMAESPLDDRMAAGSAYIGRELIIWGGYGEDRERLSDGAAYDPATDTWRALPPAPLDAAAPIAVEWTGREVLVWGSDARPGGSREGAAYDPASDSWRTLPEAPLSINLGRAVWIQGGPQITPELIVIGSQVDNNNAAETPTAVAMAYDPAADSWRRLPDPPLNPNAVTAAWTGEEVIAYDYGLKAAAYDPLTDEWRQLPDLPLDGAECYPSAEFVGRYVFAWYCGEAALFDVSAGAWERIEVPDEPILGEPVVAGEVVMFAGGSHASEFNSLWTYVPPGGPPAQQ